jgi:hypothetical protein
MGYGATFGVRRWARTRTLRSTPDAGTRFSPT